MNHSHHWLTASGEERRRAVEEAAELLLQNYPRRFSMVAPTDLHVLASSLNAEIVEVKGLKGGARILPRTHGFLVLVSDELQSSRYRTAIAHELAHTLFYTYDSNTPRRMLRQSIAEEHFCFDVARRLLAPHWLLNSIEEVATNDAHMMFDSLVRLLCLSRPIAARVMLEDYKLVRGVAGGWKYIDGQWSLKRGYCYANPLLNASERKLLHISAQRWLEKKVSLTNSRRVSGTISPCGNTAFVIAHFLNTEVTSYVSKHESIKTPVDTCVQLELNFDS